MRVERQICSRCRANRRERSTPLPLSGQLTNLPACPPTHSTPAFVLSTIPSPSGALCSAPPLPVVGAVKAELSFLVSNMAHAQRGTLVLDPFAGTASILLRSARRGQTLREGRWVEGSQLVLHRAYRSNYDKHHARRATVFSHAHHLLLVHSVWTMGSLGGSNSSGPRALGREYLELPHRVSPTLRLSHSCAAHGAVVIGSDLDIRCLRGRPRRNVRTNFIEQGLPPPDLLGCDQAHAPWRLPSSGLFDAIVCDPPYGIREGQRACARSALDACGQRRAGERTAPVFEQGERACVTRAGRVLCAWRLIPILVLLPPSPPLPPLP